MEDLRIAVPILVVVVDSTTTSVPERVIVATVGSGLAAGDLANVKLSGIEREGKDARGGQKGSEKGGGEGTHFGVIAIYDTTRLAWKGDV